jgi:hypothetical protein
MTMKKHLVLVAFFLVAGVISSGCGAYHYTVKVNGYTEPAAPAVTPGSSLFVIENQKAKNPLLEKEIKDKINKLLEKQGYSPAPYEKADYYLLYSYGMGGEGSNTVVMPDSGPYAGGGFGIGTGYGGRSASYFFVAPFFSYYPYAESVALYDRWLLINVVDGKYYREKGQFKTIWVGEARSTGTSSDLRTVLNYLLLADLKKLGQNTGKAVTVEIGEQEPLVYGLTPPK